MSGEQYNKEYYQSGNYASAPYEEPAHWIAFFGNIADHIVEELKPATVLDAGCAMGYLVAALRDRGVEAYGLDISEYAISKVREDIRPYCFVGSLTEPLPEDMPRHYDLIVTIEVLEHLIEEDRIKAINHLMSLSEQILFSSTPDDMVDPTHINVQQREYWVRLFTEQGFYDDLTYSPLYVTAYALFFRKGFELYKSVENYERYIGKSDAAARKQRAEIETLKIASVRQREQQNAQEQTILEQRVRIEQLEAQNRYLSESFDIISSSACWKITKPVRFVLDNIKASLRPIKKKLLPVCYHIDEFSGGGNKLHISGWIFDRRNEIEKLELMLCWNGTEEIIEITKRRLRREDVETAFQTKMGLRSGFDQFFRMKLPPADTIRAYLLYTVNGQRKRIQIHGLHLAQSKSSAMLDQNGCVRDQFLSSEYRCTPLPEYVDIIVPVYNGYSYLEKLFDGLREADSRHRIIFIDDNSPDKQVLPALRRFASERENVTVLHNAQNLGFVKTVNRGLETATQHVVILNTDVELPRGWIERLMEPIFQFENVASVTPFSNCATIFSFPEFGDNTLYQNLSVDELDGYFRSVEPQYTVVPTGVGFCMGMSRKALDAVGLLDDELFEKGYGEENDWCQRAIKAGFVNVHAENVFVYHKHGGSFLSEEKKRLIEEHTARLNARHPNYPADVAEYIRRDPLKNLRAHLRFRIRSAKAENNNILVLSHDLGGGADMYLDTQCPTWQAQGSNIFLLHYCVESDDYRLSCMFSGETFELDLADWEDLLYLMRDCAISQIMINELVTYPDLFTRLTDILRLKQAKGACLIMLIHDYLSVSPSLNLVSSQDWVYAREGNGFHCDRFYEQDGWAEQYNCPSIEIWRQRWEQFLLDCDEVRCFSEDSRKILNDVYPSLRNLSVIPHTVDYMPVVIKEKKTTASLNIGLLGMLTPHKGKPIVRALLELIERDNRNIKIVLLGADEGDPIPIGPHFEKTGRYAHEDVPALVLEKDIDVFLMPSIWPETFSYTTEEIIQMGLPITCLNMGAPAERVKHYEKGCVLTSTEPKTILHEICAFADRLHITQPREKDMKRFLFVAEYLSFSSRYRVDHAREQLFAAGIASDFVEAKDLDRRINIRSYDGIYIYRCRYLPPLKTILAQAKGSVPILYDIDDYIFDNEKIQALDFLKSDEYSDFDKYSKDILQCMQQCDAFVTSTEALANAIREKFPGRSVFVNRNHASAAMYVLSKKAISHDPGHNGIVLGYFSGSKTHDKDFAIIEDELCSLMRKYPTLCLLVGGCCQLSSKFNEFGERIKRNDFVSWRELPAMIRSTDINLMPLTESFFNTCKSENKWMEAALVERVTVGSINTELEVAIDENNTAFCHAPHDFENRLSVMIESKEIRDTIAQRAHRAVCEEKLTIRDYKAFAEFLCSFCK